MARKSTYVSLPDFKLKSSHKFYLREPQSTVRGASFEAILPRTELIRGLTYWDHFVYIAPAVPMAGVLLRLDDFSSVLHEKKALEIRVAQGVGYFDQLTRRGDYCDFGATATGNLFAAIQRELSNELSKAGSQPTVGLRTPFRPSNVYDTNRKSIDLSIRNAIPFPLDSTDPSRFADWRLEFATERRRLNQAISILTSDIEASKDPQTALNDFQKELSDNFEFLSRKGGEKGVNFSFGSSKLRISPKDIGLWDFIKEVGAVGGGMQLFSPASIAVGVAGVAGLHAAFSFSLSREPVPRKAESGFPFEQLNTLGMVPGPTSQIS